MWKFTVRLLSRPKGPPGLRPGREYRYTVPYRSEVAMLSLAKQPKFNSNIRELFKKPLESNNIKAIPRDLGEIPRKFVMCLLFLHQPIRLLDLWEQCKQQNDVPLDSAKHLRLVLKIAKLQRWVYTEKNQADNLYYFYLHRSRSHEVQEMIRQQEIAMKEEEVLKEKKKAEEEREAASKREEAMADSIRLMQMLVEQNIAQIRTLDPSYEIENEKEVG